MAEHESSTTPTEQPKAVRKRSLVRKLTALGIGARVEVIWVDASMGEGEEGQPGEIGGLQLLRSIGYISNIKDDGLVLARNASFMDSSHRGSETIPIDNLVRVASLVEAPGAIEFRKWLKRAWIIETMAGGAHEKI